MTRILFVFAFALVACTDSTTPGDDDSPPGGCALGDSMACTCSSGGQGTAFCDDNGNFGVCGMCGPVDPDPAKVNFQAEVVPILERSCGSGSSACHARNQYGANMQMDCRGWLTLENAALGSKFYSGSMNGQPTGCPDLTLHQRLTQIQPWECASGSSYIKPSNPTGSYIMNKINGAPLCNEGGAPSVQMPPSDSTFKLTAADKAVLQKWIEEGALDN